jgi:hypothetical protein
MTKTPDTIKALRAAARRKAAADEAYRDALEAAYAEGHSFAELARAAEVAGATRQSVRGLLTYEPVKPKR